MQAEERDAALLQDMLRACEDIAAFTLGKGEDQFVDDRQCCLAVERCLEITGEAVRRISPAFRGAHPEIAWHRILGLRNILAHEYGYIEGPLIYKTAMQDVPVLAAALRAMLASGVREQGTGYPLRKELLVRLRRLRGRLPEGFRFDRLEAHER